MSKDSDITSIEWLRWKIESGGGHISKIDRSIAGKVVVTVDLHDNFSTLSPHTPVRATVVNEAVLK